MRAWELRHHYGVQLRELVCRLVGHAKPEHRMRCVTCSRCRVVLFYYGMRDAETE